MKLAPYINSMRKLLTQVAKEWKCSVPTHNGTLGGDPNGLQPAEDYLSAQPTGVTCTLHAFQHTVTRSDPVEWRK